MLGFREYFQETVQRWGVDPALLPGICIKNMKSCSTKAEAAAANPACPAVPRGLASALGRASGASKPPEALLPVVIQLEFKDALFFWIIPRPESHRSSRGGRLKQLVHKTSGKLLCLYLTYVLLSDPCSQFLYPHLHGLSWSPKEHPNTDHACRHQLFL